MKISSGDIMEIIISNDISLASSCYWIVHDTRQIVINMDSCGNEIATGSVRLYHILDKRFVEELEVRNKRITLESTQDHPLAESYIIQLSNSRQIILMSEDLSVHTDRFHPQTKKNNSSVKRT